jgi:hypothetical protein
MVTTIELLARNYAIRCVLPPLLENMFSLALATFYTTIITDKDSNNDDAVQES